MDEQKQGFISFVESHPTLMLIFGGLVVFLIGYSFLHKKVGSITGTSTTAAGVSGDLSGLSTDAAGNKIVYVATTSQFNNTTNYTQNSNDPNLTSIANSPSTGTTTTINYPATVTPVGAIPKQSNTPPASTSGTHGTPPTGSGTPVVTSHPTNPNPMPPVRANPVPVAAPPLKGTLSWSTSYIVVRGDTLSGIATKVNTKLKQQGSPLTITYHDIFAHNQAKITADSASHGTPIKGFAAPTAQNNIFPGEVITVPTYIKG